MCLSYSILCSIFYLIQACEPNNAQCFVVKKFKTKFKGLLIYDRTNKKTQKQRLQLYKEDVLDTERPMSY